jgi:hypothetical protein
MILINFSHPITPEQCGQIEALLSLENELEIVDLAVHFDPQQPFEAQVGALLAQLPLNAKELQSEPILVNLPALNYIAALLLAELHGRMGYFPPVLRLRPVKGSLPPRYEAAEVLNLQAVREQARSQR